MNEDIEGPSKLEDDLDISRQQIDEAGQPGNLANCQIEAVDGCIPNILNPKNYAFVPSCWTAGIRPAGRQTAKSDNAGAAIFGRAF